MPSQRPLRQYQSDLGTHAPPIIAAGKGRKPGSALQFYGNIFGLHIVPEGLATFLAAIAGFTKPTERCLDAAGIPFVDEHLPSAQFSYRGVERALRPACKADHLLILEGAQGAGKSTAIRILCGDAYFGDSLPKLDSKDAADYVRGKWIIELAELSSVSKTEVEHVKAFITRTEEKFRPAYRHNEIAYQRRCVFIGTTNRTDYLRDETGNRRFWPIKLEAVDVATIETDRDKIWAAAKAIYDAGEHWLLTDAEALLAEAQ